MKWNTLSAAALTLVRQLGDESNAWLGRRRKMNNSLRALAALGEPSAIPKIVDFLLDDNRAAAREAAHAVGALFARMSPDQLPTLDERIRSDSDWGFPRDRWRKLSSCAIDGLLESPTHSLALGLAACHGSGYVRQNAVVCLDREITSGAEIPFLLLRLNDWVSAVRHSAEHAIERRLTDTHRAAYLQNLSLVAQLRRRQRASESPALAQIEALLRADAIALVIGALASDERGARRFGLSLALDSLGGAELAICRAVIERVVESNNPAERFRATCWLTKPTTTLRLQSQFLPRLLTDRSAAVRRAALGWFVANDPDGRLAALHDALLDESGMVRSLAQFHLPKLESIDLRGFYGEAIHHHGSRNLKAALGGLGETGRTEDAELIVPLVDAPVPKIRKAALRALAKLASEAHIETLINALQANSPAVSRIARIALTPLASRAGFDRLTTIFESAGSEHVRLQTLFLINELPKWAKLPVLIEASAQDDGMLGRVAERFLRRWLAGFNRTHQILPNKADMLRLRAALSAHACRLEPGIARELSALQKSFP